MKSSAVGAFALVQKLTEGTKTSSGLFISTNLYPSIAKGVVVSIGSDQKTPVTVGDHITYSPSGAIEFDDNHHIIYISSIMTIDPSPDSQD